MRLPLRVWTDSTASMGICQRQGLGKLRHVDTRALWLQQKVRRGEVELRKVKGTENPADLFTKPLSSPTAVEGLLKAFGCEYRAGRPEGAPELRRGQGTQAGALLSLLERGYKRGKEQDKLWLAEGSEGPGEKLVVTQGGHTYAATRCEELEGQLVAEARSYHQGRLPHQVAGDLAVYFPRAEACPDIGDQDPEMDDTLEKRGLRQVEKEQGLPEGRLQGEGSKRHPLGYFTVKTEGGTMSFVRSKEKGTEAK